MQRKHFLELNSFKKNITNDSIPEVTTMSGLEFEHFLGKLFDKIGHNTEVTKASRDQRQI